MREIARYEHTLKLICNRRFFPYLLWSIDGPQPASISSQVDDSRRRLTTCSPPKAVAGANCVEIMQMLWPTTELSTSVRSLGRMVVSLRGEKKSAIFIKWRCFAVSQMLVWPAAAGWFAIHLWGNFLRLVHLIYAELILWQVHQLGVISCIMWMGVV